MGEPGVEDEGFRLAEGVDHAVQEAHEEGGVEAHRAGGVEQDDQPQRLVLAAAPDEIDRRAAMRDAAVDGAAQIEPAAAPAHPLAPHQPRAHDARQPLGQRMRLRDVGGIDDVAQIGAGEVLEARGAFALAAAVAGGIAVLVAPLDVVGQARRAAARADIFERARAARGLPSAVPASVRAWRRPRPQPIGVEDLVEALPVGMGRAEQRAQRRLERRRPRRERRVRIASASPVSASPTLKPLSRSVRAKPARRRRVGGPSDSASQRSSPAAEG